MKSLSAEDREILGRIAREALRAAVTGDAYTPADPARPALSERRGCFVTLRTRGALRGCLGCFASDLPLYRTVAAYAGYSATEDPRFAGNRLQSAELPGTAVEISVLTPLTPCDDPYGIIPGVHGIQVSSGGRSGCFLPQVATEMSWGIEDFWGHCCRDKAMLDWDAWKHPETRLMTFTAEAFDA